MKDFILRTAGRAARPLAAGERDKELFFTVRAADAGDGAVSCRAGCAAQYAGAFAPALVRNAGRTHPQQLLRALVRQQRHTT